MKIAITGSGGLLGKFLSNEALAAGHQVVPISFAHINSEPFLEPVIQCLAPLKECAIIIHCAAAKKPKNLFEQYLNTQVPYLIEQYIIEQQLACRLVHISSMNVVINELQDHYTLSKRKAESLLDPKITTIIRPGLIWSPAHDPSIQKISTYLRTRYLPHLMLKPGNWYSPIDPASLAEYLITKLENFRDHAQTLHVLGTQKYSLWQLIKQLSDDQRVKLFPISSIWFQFLPLHFLIKHTNFSETLNQLLPIDRTILPQDCADSLVQLPYQEH